MPETFTPAQIRELIETNRDTAKDLSGSDFNALAGLIDENADALEHLLQFVEWRDIKDAPKGGEFLSWCDFDSLKCAVVVSRESNDESTAFWDWNTVGINESVPTHFVPLPPPPE